jgi:ligand-binding SRPBCC domain-containing protein
MRKEYRFRFASRLLAPPDMVWSHLSRTRGINEELWPLAQMTFPAKMRKHPLEAWGKGRVGRSLILLFGFIPVDLHHLGLEVVAPRSHFHEQSASLLFRSWTHWRRLREVEGGTEVVDELNFEARRWVPAFLLAPVYRLVFRHRHRRLRRKFGRAVFEKQG